MINILQIGSARTLLLTHYSNDNPARYVEHYLDECEECGSDHFEGQGKRMVCKECRHVKIFR